MQGKPLNSIFFPRRPHIAPTLMVFGMCVTSVLRREPYSLRHLKLRDMSDFIKRFLKVCANCVYLFSLINMFGQELSKEG